MSKCGHITTTEKGNLMGTFLSWQHPALDFALREVKQRAGDKSPTHEVIAKAPHGAWVVIGAAWENEIRKGEKAGSNCFSLQLDEPLLFPQPVKLSAFPTEAGGEDYQLTFDRSERPAQQDQGGPEEYEFESERNAA